MPLEQAIGPNEFNSILGKPFGIDPSLVYEHNENSPSRAEFVGKAGSLFDLRDYYKAVGENSNDVGAWDDLKGLIHRYMSGDKNRNAQILKNPNNAALIAKRLIDGAYVNMARFIEHNEDVVLNHTPEKQLLEVINSVQLYRTDDERHERASYLINKNREIDYAKKETGNVMNAIGEEVQEAYDRIPDEWKAIMSEVSEMQESLAVAVEGKLKKAHKGLFKDDAGNLSRAKLKSFLQENYEVIRDLMNIAGLSEGEKNDLWDKNLKGQYIALAEKFYKPEKKTLKREKDSAKEDRKEIIGRMGASI